jgi:hypothetical protein
MTTAKWISSISTMSVTTSVPQASVTPNDDGIVDIQDLNAVRNNFGTSAAGNAVPEPSSLWLIGFGLTSLLAARRARKSVPYGNKLTRRHFSAS